METTSFIVISTKDEKIRNKLLSLIADSDVDSKDYQIRLHEVGIMTVSGDDDVPDLTEPGDYILFYDSPSHKKRRYYVAPPPALGTKPEWSYKIKDAARLSKKALQVISEYVSAMGYQAPMTIRKYKTSNGGSAVVEVDFGKKETEDA